MGGRPVPNSKFWFALLYNFTGSHNYRELYAEGIKLKTWASPVKMDNNTCPCCLRNPITYNTTESLEFAPVMFEHTKQYGLAPMHKKICFMVMLWNLAEKKEKSIHGGTCTQIRNKWRCQERLTIINWFNSLFYLNLFLWFNW